MHDNTLSLVGMPAAPVKIPLTDWRERQRAIRAIGDHALARRRLEMLLSEVLARMDEVREAASVER